VRNIHKQRSHQSGVEQGGRWSGAGPGITRECCGPRNGTKNGAIGGASFERPSDSRQEHGSVL